ncbi:MAG: hypothetical protein ACJ8F7_08075 [Gemmataceae bacterium]
MRPTTATIFVVLFAFPPCRVAAGVPAIPQDPEKQEQLEREKLSWNRRTLGGAYEKVGKKDARWDDQARVALEKAAQYFCDPLASSAAEHETYMAAKQAIDAGCDDPLIIYLFARMSYGPDDPGEAEKDRRYTAAATAMQNSAYPYHRRYVALYKAGQSKASLAGNSPQVRAEAEKLLDAALQLLPKSQEEDDLGPNPEHHVYDLIESAEKAHAWLSGNKIAAFLRVQNPLVEFSVKSPAIKFIMLSHDGQHWIDRAWEARGSGYADTVTKEGWKEFRKLLTAARQSLQNAWAGNPRDGKIAARMMWVVIGLDLGRAEMEMWFERAMKADPDNRKACLNMMEYLEPKWHGSLEEMMAFGRACAATKNWRSGIPLLLADAHRRASYYEDKDKRVKYFKSSVIYGEISKLYSECLKQRPADSRAQTECAMYCYFCGRYEEADQHFQAVGDHLWQGEYFSVQRMKEARATSATFARDARVRRGAEAPAKGKTGEPVFHQVSKPQPIDRSRDFAEHKCRYTLPGKEWAWNEPPPPGVLCMASRPGGFFLTVKVTEQRGASHVGEKFAAEFDKDFFQTGQASKRGGRFVAFQGLPCYQVEATEPGGHSMVNRAFLANGVVYSVNLTGGTAPLEQKPDFEDIMNGFSFTEPPVEPIPAHAGHGKWFYYLGVGAFVCLVVAVAARFALRPASPKKPQEPQTFEEEVLDVLPAVRPSPALQTALTTSRPAPPPPRRQREKGSEY